MWSPSAFILGEGMLRWSSPFPCRQRGGERTHRGRQAVVVLAALLADMPTSLVVPGRGATSSRTADSSRSATVAWIAVRICASVVRWHSCHSERGAGRSLASPLWGQQSQLHQAARGIFWPRRQRLSDSGGRAGRQRPPPSRDHSPKTGVFTVGLSLGDATP